MTISDPIGLWLVASVATGLTAHVALAARNRRTYHRLREAYVGAVTAAQQTGAANALVRAQELHRDFMRATAPSWLTGLGARLRAALAVCGLAGVAVMVATSSVPPIVAGVAVLLAIGLRRVLLAAALLLALFAATSALAPLRPADRSVAARLSSPSHAARPPAPSR